MKSKQPDDATLTDPIDADTAIELYAAHLKQYPIVSFILRNALHRRMELYYGKDYANMVQQIENRFNTLETFAGLNQSKVWQGPAHPIIEVLSERITVLEERVRALTGRVSELQGERELNGHTR